MTKKQTRHTLYVALRKGAYWLDYRGINPKVYNEFREDFKLLERKVTDTYQKQILEEHARHDHLVLEALDGKARFSEIGQPIIKRADEIYQQAKNNRFKFKKGQILEAPQCRQAVKEIETIISIDHFQSKKLISEKDEKAIEKILKLVCYDKNKPYTYAISPIVTSILGIGLSIAAMKMIETDSELIKGGAITLGFLSMPGAAMYMHYLLADRTAESAIKQPAERLQANLKYIDDAINRIYWDEK